MSWQHELGRARAVAWKDLTAERRVLANFVSLSVLAVVILMLFGFAFGPETEAVRTAAAAVLWLTVLLSGVLATLPGRVVLVKWASAAWPSRRRASPRYCRE